MFSYFKLYSRLEDHETVLEIWGGSTKHPDVTFHFSKFETAPWFEDVDQIVPWVLECASKLAFPINSYRLGEWIMAIAAYTYER